MMQLHPTTTPLHRMTAATAALLTASSLLLSGCGIATSTATSASGSGGAAAVIRVQGRVYGGQQPVKTSLLQLYTVGTSGPASAATALLPVGGAAITTGTDGGFDITGKYSCASATQVYLVATGGDAGQGTNSALTLMAALGPCSALQATTNIVVNELTTVAADYALAPFMTSISQVGATGSNPVGLVNAFQSAQMLVDTSTGAPRTQAGLTVPVRELDTLANILAACVNTSGPGSTGCTSLLTATSTTDTASAGLAIARNPGNSALTALWSLPNGDVPFQPTLSAAPNDFTLSVRYSGTELAAPYALALDASGNAWVSNEGGSSVVKLPAPGPLFATSPYSGGGLSAPRGLAIDRSGNVWVANTGANTVVELSSAGSVLSGTGYSTGTSTGPVAIAIDATGNAWVSNFLTGTIAKLNSGGTLQTTTGSGTLSAPTAVVVDSSSRVAVANSGTGQLCLFNSTGVLQSCLSDGTLFGATALAVSPAGPAAGTFALLGSTTGNAVAGAFTLVDNTGAVNTSSPITGGGLVLPTAAAYDGAGNAWFTNATSISEFAGSSALTGTLGYGTLSSPQGIAVDPSGNIWTANTGDNSITIFIGLATPVATPLAAGLPLT